MVTWTEHRNAEGRSYWYNANTKESVWEKPDDLKTPFERALAQTSWKEYFAGGRKYYFNVVKTETKESKWDMPDELLLVLEKVEKEQKPTSLGTPAAQSPTSNRLIAPSFSGSTPIPSNAVAITNGLDPNILARPLGPYGTPVNLTGMPQPTPPLNVGGALPLRPNMPDDPVIPHNGWATPEEAEKAFNHLLRKAGVDPTWTWDQTMRAIVTDPLYKSFNTLAERKAAWQKFVDSLKQKEVEEKEARLAKLRPALRNMLKGNPNVFHYTTFATADRLFAQHPIWQQAKIESERKLVFEEYVAELKQREVQESREIRARSVTKVVALFKQLEVDVMTRWRQAHNMLLDSIEWKHDAELKKLPDLDVLLAFEDYSRVKEREFEEQLRKTQIEKARRERKAREAFKALLENLVREKRIRARTKWKQIYPLFSSDSAYLDMLGKPGSTPLELFWDVVDDLDQQLDARIAIVERVLKHQDFNFTVDTREDDLIKLLKDAEAEDEEVKQLADEEKSEIWKALREDALRVQAEEKRRAERKQRHLQDDLRYALKKLDKPIDINLSYEDAAPLIEHLSEYKALDDEGRRTAFAKFVRRQKEKLKEMSEDGGSTTSRKRKEPPEQEDDRYRDKDDRSYKERGRGRDKDKDKHDRDKSKDYDKDRHSRHSRDDYDKDRREYRDRDRDRDRDYYSGRHRDSGRDKDRKKESGRGRDRERERERERDRDKRKDEMDWEETYARRGSSREHDRARSDVPEPQDDSERESSKRLADGDIEGEKRAEKKPRFEATASSRREDTPEEGEI
ncbi:hypothetical protein Clacol_005534 [Clathrus columnatus]|uniref:Pre-mRNA-processing protein prp40 n=1 Tax=Clathrus columnatus TaxID=1419009 RepID=A0AAV5ACA4_9AGAM|nr:hypothetical protein Clacol_005534 [Clathrus columnatus]